MVNRAAAGGTYPDLFTAAAEAARHRWVRSDFEEATARYYAAETPADILLGLRGRQASRNLRLVCDALAVAVRTQQPASAAGQVLASLGEAARANRSIARQAAAESRGLRMQAAILAIVIPAMFLYLLGGQPRAHRARHLDRARPVRPPASGSPPRGRRDRPVVARDEARGHSRWTSSS